MFGLSGVGGRGKIFKISVPRKSYPHEKRLSTKEIGLFHTEFHKG